MTVVACGMMVPRALEAGRMLEAEGVSAEVINMHTIKPIDAELLVASAGRTGRVVTIEEGSVVGGLGTAVCEVLSERCPARVRRIGMPDIFGTSGPGATLLDVYGLTAERIVQAAHELGA